MRLKRIEIESFKGIGARQVIELKPITLLFGPNSAGKSTILQALHYVREILERNNPDPDQTIAGGLIDLGGFKALVHNHDLDRAIIIKLVIDLSEEQGSDWLALNSGASIKDEAFKDLSVRYLVGENTDLKDYAIVQEIGLELDVRWSEQLERPYVARLTAEMDGEPVAAIQSPPQEGRAVLTDINFLHPLLQQIVDHDDIEDIEEILEEVPVGFENDPFNSPLAGEIWELSRELADKKFASEGNDFRVSVATEIGALPELANPLDSDLRDPGVSKAEHESSTPRVRALSAMLDEMVLGPARIVRDYLGMMTYIGPLREIPARSFRPQLSPDESRWAQGLAAWDLLHSDVSGKLTEKTNTWLGNEEHFGTDYLLEKVVFREIAVPSRMSMLFERGLNEDDVGELQDLYSALSVRSEVALRDSDKGIVVAPSDVGVGISQMIPVIVGCVSDRPGILAVEQPELHIHPAMQVGMGDLFIETTIDDSGSSLNKKSLLIETHSEHIILRLLRRIRETTEGDLPPGAPSMTPEGLAVVYVEVTDIGVKFSTLRVDKEGEFLDRWPRGFFEERSEELF